MSTRTGNKREVRSLKAHSGHVRSAVPNLEPADKGDNYKPQRARENEGKNVDSGASMDLAIHNHNNKILSSYMHRAPLSRS